MGPGYTELMDVLRAQGIAPAGRWFTHHFKKGLPGAWPELDAWIAAQGRKAGPSLWEVYLTDPQASPDPRTWRTELNRPLAG